MGPVDVVLVVLLAAAPQGFLSFFFSKNRKNALAARACHVQSGPFEVRRSSAKRETGNKRSSGGAPGSG